MNTLSCSPSLSSAQLRPARFEDYPAMQQLEAALLQEPLPAHEWPRLWGDNPLWPRLGSRLQIGWVLEDAAGQVVGSLSSVPSLYRLRGRELICATSKTWVVRPEYRGFAPWLLEEFFNQPGVDLVIGSSANQNAAPLLSAYADRVPVGNWESVAYWVTGYRGFAHKVLERLHLPLPAVLALPAAAALWAKDALLNRTLPSVPNIVVSTVPDFDARFDRFWEELVRQNPDRLLGVRDSKTLSWHYAIPRRRRRLWIFTAERQGLLRAYGVLNQQESNAGFRRMRLTDYQTLEPEDDLLPALLQAALQCCVAEDFHVLEHLGCGLPKMRALDQLAPYRHKLPNWSYFFHAADPVLGSELRRPEVWDPSSFDGESSMG